MTIKDRLQVTFFTIRFFWSKRLSPFCGKICLFAELEKFNVNFVSLTLKRHTLR